MPLNENQLLSVIGTYPSLGWDTDVVTQPTIQVKFNILVDENLVNTNVALNQYVTLVKLSGDEVVQVEYSSWNASTRQLEFTPATALSPGAIYQITIRKELKSAQGRRMEEDKVWTFEVSSLPVEKVTLRTPGDSTAHPNQPTLEWNGVWFASGSVTYDVNVNTNWLFTPPVTWETSVSTSTTGGIRTSSIAAVLDGDTTYYWRVRARTTAVTGEWSTTRAFYIGGTNQASPDSDFAYEEDTDFKLLETFPSRGDTHQTSWPTISGTFSQNLLPSTVTSGSSGTFYVLATSVDGRLSSSPTYIDGAIVLQNNVATFVPSVAIAQNTRYTVYFKAGIGSTSGYVLDDTETIYFTGEYKPMYGGLIEVRSLLGDMAAYLNDDEIAYHLWRAGLYVNELIYTSIHRIRLSATLDDLVDYQVVGGTTLGMVRISELYAAIRIMENYYATTLTEAGKAGALATFQFETKADILKYLADRIKKLKEELSGIEASFLLAAVHPQIGRKSQYFIPGGVRDVDLAYTYRKQF